MCVFEEGGGDSFAPQDIYPPIHLSDSDFAVITQAAAHYVFDIVTTSLICAVLY
jgi:hypothetical protein